MSDETNTILTPELTKELVAAVIEGLKGISTGSIYEMTDEQKEAAKAKQAEGLERKRLVKRLVMGDVLSNLSGINTERQANNISRTAGAKARLLMAAMAACDAFDNGEARLDGRMTRNFGVNPNPWGGY